jgi:hypothetical protein
LRICGRRRGGCDKDRTNFAHQSHKLDEAGELIEHLAGVDDFQLAEAVYQAARKRWPDQVIVLRDEARVILDSRQETWPEAAADQIVAD